jgi:hypothetical protein
MSLRKLFRCLDRPPVTPDLTANDMWVEPPGHSTEFAYRFYQGGWGEWKHIFVSDTGPKQWVFVPFEDQQIQLGDGRMIYKQHSMPQGAQTGSAWVCPHGSFKRVLSRGGAWENVTPGTTHPDEVSHEEKKQRPKAEQRVDVAEVPSGTGESTQGDGDNGEVSGVPVAEPEDPGVTFDSASEPDSTGQSAPSTEAANNDGPQGEGVDGNGSPVV